jgi:Cdc6-like AAA superfamily ATPase
MTPQDVPDVDPDLSAARKDELDEIAAFLRGNQSVAIVGPAQAGKTTLLRHLSHPALWPSVGLGEDNLFVYIDCATLQDRSYDQIFGLFASGMATALEQRLLAPEPALDIAMARPARLSWEAAIRRLNQRGQRIALILDDFENLSSNPHIGVGFFNVLRSMTARYQLVLLTASTRPLIDLTYTGCPEEIVSSPFFNIFASVSLAPLPSSGTPQGVRY